MDKRVGEMGDYVGRMPLFEGLDAGLVAGIAATSCRKRAGTKERIYEQGDEPRAFYYVLSGHVRRAITSVEGDEKLIDIVATGRHFGLPDLFGGLRYVSYAEAVEPTLLLEIGRDGLVAAMEGSRNLSFRILTALAERQLAFEQEIAATFFHSGCRRLLDYILSEAGPNPDNAGNRIVKLSISKALIAKRIGVTAETLSRALRDLSNAGLISVHGRTITLLDKLTARHGAMVEEVDKRLTAAEQHRRRTDTWGDHTALTEPLGSRAWL